jgi:BirA family transcriptional regulator, biotin operon repressor / biotin---[acetyl-CoA-carboxylase] ligase
MPFEQLSAENILSCLRTREIGRNLLYLPNVSSTMDVALEEVLRLAPHGTVVVADAQSHGKGRLKRGWISPVGGVYLSVILYPSQELITSLTMIACMAVIDCIQEVCGIKAAIKWPNDVLINSKKVSGVLAQSGNSPSGQCYSVVGIGINADVDLTGEPEIQDIATSLSTAAGRAISRRMVICSLLNNFEKRYSALQAGKSSWKEWRERLVTLGHSVCVKSPYGVVEGIAESVTPKGNLLLRQTDGTLKEIPAGEITPRD